MVYKVRRSPLLTSRADSPLELVDSTVPMRTGGWRSRGRNRPGPATGKHPALHAQQFVLMVMESNPDVVALKATRAANAIFTYGAWLGPHLESIGNRQLA